MAWKARVAKKTTDNDQFTLAIEFFDDVNPQVVLLREDMTFPPGMSRTEIIAEVKARGARERAVQTQLAQLATLINVGDEVTI